MLQFDTTTYIPLAIHATFIKTKKLFHKFNRISNPCRKVNRALYIDKEGKGRLYTADGKDYLKAD